MYDNASDDAQEILNIIKKQRIPSDYKDDYRRAREEEEEKKEKLSADGRIVHALLGYREGCSPIASNFTMISCLLLLGIDALEEHMKKEYSVENLELYKSVR